MELRSAVSGKEDWRLVPTAQITIARFYVSFGARMDGNINSIENNSSSSDKMGMKSF